MKETARELWAKIKLLIDKVKVKVRKPKEEPEEEKE